MVRKTKGLSLLATSLIIIAIVISIAVGVWIFSQKYTVTTHSQISSQFSLNGQSQHTKAFNQSQIKAQLNLLSYSLTGSNPVYNIRLTIQSNFQKSLLLKGIEITAVYQNGSIAHLMLVPHGNKWVLYINSHYYETINSTNTIVINTNSINVIVYSFPPIYISPHSHTVLSISIIANEPIIKVSMLLYLKGPSGQIYTVNSGNIEQTYAVVTPSPDHSEGAS